MSLLSQKTELGSELNDINHNLSGAFSPDIESVKITKRFPNTGLPPNGIPLSIDVEVNVSRTTGSLAKEWVTNFLLVPLAVKCPNVVLITRQADATKRILSSNKVITDLTRGCIGDVKITLPADFRPKDRGNIFFEVYDEGTTIKEIQSNEVEPIFTSANIPLNISTQEGIQAGLINQATGQFGIPTDFSVGGSLFGGFQKTVTSLTTFLAVGTGGYLIWKNSDSIKNGIKKLTGK